MKRSGSWPSRKPSFNAFAKAESEKAQTAGRRTSHPEENRIENTLDEIQAKTVFSDRWNKADVRGALSAMHGTACAYCLCPRNGGLHVDHFRPKSKYPWLAYDFSNYFLSCPHCNRCKSNAFPLEGSDLPMPYSMRMLIHDERRLLLDPVEDPVEEWMELNVEGPMFYWRVSARGALDERAQKRVKKTIEVFRLNSANHVHHERIRCLSGALRDLESIKIGNADALEALQRKASRYRDYGGAVRQLIFWLDGSLLPTPAKELEFLIDDTIVRLVQSNKVRDDFEVCGDLCTPAYRLWRKMRDELLWLLAVLWKDPPAMTPKYVEGVLDSYGFREEVCEFYRQL